MDIREQMLPVLQPSGGKEEIDKLIFIINEKDKSI